jgi:hypothetical protein
VSRVSPGFENQSGWKDMSTIDWLDRCDFHSAGRL